MAKNPAFQFYPRDWLSDTELQQSSASNRGIWINLLSHMWFSRERGVVRGTPQEISRLGGCTEVEWELFFAENSRLKFADVTFCDGNVTVKNRRMVREEKARESTRLRVERHRIRGSNRNVTVPSPSTPSPSTPSTPNTSTKPIAARGAPRRLKSDPNIKLLLDFYHDTYLAIHKTKPVISGGKDGAICRKLLTGRTLDEARWIVEEHLKHPPDLYERKNLYGLNHVLAAANTILARKNEYS